MHIATPRAYYACPHPARARTTRTTNRSTSSPYGPYPRAVDVDCRRAPRGACTTAGLVVDDVPARACASGAGASACAGAGAAQAPRAGGCEDEYLAGARANRNSNGAVASAGTATAAALPIRRLGAHAGRGRSRGGDVQRDGRVDLRVEAGEPKHGLQGGEAPSQGDRGRRHWVAAGTRHRCSSGPSYNGSGRRTAAAATATAATTPQRVRAKHGGACELARGRSGVRRSDVVIVVEAVRQARLQPSEHVRSTASEPDGRHKQARAVGTHAPGGQRDHHAWYARAQQLPPSRRAPATTRSHCDGGVE